jgi:hypothetical protein
MYFIKYQTNSGVFCMAVHEWNTHDIDNRAVYLLGEKRVAKYPPGNCMRNDPKKYAV